MFMTQDLLNIHLCLNILMPYGEFYMQKKNHGNWDPKFYQRPDTWASLGSKDLVIRTLYEDQTFCYAIRNRLYQKILETFNTCIQW